MNLQLNTATNDIIIGSRSPNRISGREYVAQVVACRLRTIEGEWEVDPTVGIPWLTGLLEKQTPVEYLELLISTVIEQTTGVLSVEQVATGFDRKTRAFTYNFVARSTYGEFTGGG